MTTDDRPRRPASHAAAGGRILAAGISASVAVGLVAVMARPRAEDVVLTVTQPQPAVAPPETMPMTTAPPQVVVVIVEDGPAPPPSLTVPAPPAPPPPRPAVTPTTARPDTKTRAS